MSQFFFVVAIEAPSYDINGYKDYNKTLHIF